MIFQAILPLREADFTAVSCVCYLPSGKILLLKKRADHPDYGNLYGFVAGKVRDEETPEQAVQREIEEETGNIVLLEDIVPIISLSSRHIGRAGDFSFICQNFYLKKRLPGVRLNKEEHDLYIGCMEEDILMYWKKEAFIPDAWETFKLFYEMHHGFLKVGQKAKCLGVMGFHLMTGTVTEISRCGTMVRLIDQDGRDSWWGRRFVKALT